jgi:hypothetical protein
VRAFVIFVFVVVLAVAVVYVAWGADTFVFGLGYEQGRERAKLVTGALSALAAPISLWVALTAYRLNAKLAGINLEARLDVVPVTEANIAQRHTVRYADRTDTDVASCHVQFTGEPDGEPDGEDSGEPPKAPALYCAVPFLNRGPSRATVVKSRATLPGHGEGEPRPAATVIDKGDIVFMTFVWRTGTPTDLPTVGPHVSVRYLDGSGEELEIAGTVGGVAATESWHLQDVGQSSR